MEPRNADPYPAYAQLARTGELRRRASQALETLRACRACPRQCGVDRTAGTAGACGIAEWARVASYGPHLGEEDCLRGWRGSGTIFFSGCNLRCVFCQNWDISHELAGATVSVPRLAEMMLELQAAGCHNINWVTPSHVAAQALAALALAADDGLRLPVVYNCGGYETIETLRWFEGLVDIYMPDFKFWVPEVAARLAQAPDYPEIARQALREMHRQVGELMVDEEGLARRGLLVRHLVMPGDLAGTASLARWLATEVSPQTYLNVMAQYRPEGDVLLHPHQPGYRELARPVTPEECRRARVQARAAGLHRFDQRRPWFFPKRAARD